MNPFWLLLFLALITFFMLRHNAVMIARASAAKQAAESEKESSELRPIDREEETYLRNCFPWTVYYLQDLEYRPQAVICRGQLRTNPEAAYQRIRENVEAKFGDRFLVVFQESLSGKPFFALVPNPHKHREVKRDAEPLTRPWIAIGLLSLTLLTTTLAGAKLASVFGQAPDVTNIAQLLTNPGFLFKGLLYALALIAILGCREVVHYLAIRFYKIRSTLPYFMPVPFVPGTIGAFIQIRAPVPNRKALFDIGISGPLASLLVSLPILWFGLSHSEVVPIPAEPDNQILNFDTVNPRFSFLLALMSKLALGSQLTDDRVLNLHPIAVAGLLGLAITALNLMPIGQLDGGHVVHAMFGQRAGVAIGQVTRLLVFVMAIIRPYLLLWAIVLLLFIRYAFQVLWWT